MAFSKETTDAAWRRAGGKCECTRKTCTKYFCVFINRNNSGNSLYPYISLGTRRYFKTTSLAPGFRGNSFRAYRKWCRIYMVYH